MGTVALDYSLAAFDYAIGTNPTFTTDLRSSLDGFTSSLGLHTSSPGISDYSDSIASLGQQSGTVTFRLYGSVDSNTGSSGFYAGNMDFNGIAVVVPEPSTGGLIAEAGLLLAYLRRRRG